MFPDMNYFLTINMGKKYGNFFLNKRCLDKIAGLIDVIQHNKMHCDIINIYMYESKTKTLLMDLFVKQCFLELMKNI